MNGGPRWGKNATRHSPSASSMCLPTVLSGSQGVGGLLSHQRRLQVCAGLGTVRRPPPHTHLSAPGSPDEDALVVIALPQAAVALVGDGEDVRRELAQMAPAVQLHGGALVQAGDGLIGVHRGDDGADVGLQAEGKGRAALPGGGEPGSDHTSPALHSAQGPGPTQGKDSLTGPRCPWPTPAGPTP